MTIRALKRAVRRIGKRLGLANDAAQSPRQMDESYYDEAFDKDTHYHVPFYKSNYYSTWILIVDRLRRYGCRKILDIGCGPGQFAGLIDDAGFEAYTGLDFSSVAIERARPHAPRFTFRVADVMLPASYAGIDFDAIICMEVLEHIDNDFAVVSCFPSGKRCLMTVPNFPWKSHVRHFTSEQSVSDRYGRFFQEFTVTRLKGTRNESEQFYLLDGIRNEVTS